MLFVLIPLLMDYPLWVEPESRGSVQEVHVLIPLLMDYPLWEGSH